MGCNGGLMDYAFQYIKENNGIDTEASYPYEARNGKCRFDPRNVGATDTVSLIILYNFNLTFFSLQGFVDIKSKNETDLQVALATIGPISVAIDAGHTSFQLYKKGGMYFNS